MRKYLELFKQTFKEFGEDKAPRLGAALAYYTVFSIAPLLLIAISIAGFVFGDEAARNQISTQLSGLMGDSTAKTLEEMVQAAAKPKAGAIATIIGIVALLFGASGVFAQLEDALDTIWDVERPKKAGILGTIKSRFLSLMMVLGIGFLLMVSLVFDAVVSAMGKYVEHMIPGGEPVMQVIQNLVSLCLVTVMFAAMFKYLPHIKIAWKDVWRGAIFTAALFVLGKIGLGLYIGKAAFGSSYGAAGSLVILLVWVYWSAQILFFGAEFTQVYTRSVGTLKNEAAAPAKTEAVPVPAKPSPQPRKKGGGVIPIAATGIVGILLGALVGAISATLFVFKSLRKLLPFR